MLSEDLDQMLSDRYSSSGLVSVDRVSWTPPPTARGLTVFLAHEWLRVLTRTFEWVLDAAKTVNHEIEQTHCSILTFVSSEVRCTSVNFIHTLVAISARESSAGVNASHCSSMSMVLMRRHR